MLFYIPDKLDHWSFLWLITLCHTQLLEPLNFTLPFPLSIWPASVWWVESTYPAYTRFRLKLLFHTGPFLGFPMRGEHCFSFLKQALTNTRLCGTWEPQSFFLSRPDPPPPPPVCIALGMYQHFSDNSFHWKNSQLYLTTLILQEQERPNLKYEIFTSPQQNGKLCIQNTLVVTDFTQRPWRQSVVLGLFPLLGIILSLSLDMPFLL